MRVQTMWKYQPLSGAKLRGYFIAVILFALLANPLQGQEAPPELTVGMTGKITGLVLPGTELEAKPYDNRKLPILLRIRSVVPIGTSFRYDLEYQGYDPGSYDLKNYLRRKDGGSTSDLPAIPVKFVPIRPPGQMEPNTLEIDQSFWMGGYRWWLLAGGLVWLGGLFFIIYYGFWPKRHDAATAPVAPLTLADRLRPLVERAMAGQSKPEELASLERCLLAWWRRKLGVDGQAMMQGAEQLRNHAEAGPLLKQLELWLHRPGTRDQVDVSKLLQPYRLVQADALELTEVRA